MLPIMWNQIAGRYGRGVGPSLVQTAGARGRLTLAFAVSTLLTVTANAQESQVANKPSISVSQEGLAPQATPGQGGTASWPVLPLDAPPMVYTIGQTQFYRDIEHARQVYHELVHGSGAAQADANAGHAAWAVSLPALPGNKVSAGDEYDGLVVLAQRLIALGDLSSRTALPLKYEGELVLALTRFQRRHGLTVDGILGPATLRALNVSPAQRLTQIDRNLARLRAAPPFRGNRSVVVNLPEFVLRTYKHEAGESQQQHTIRVIVGKAMNTDTPMFDENIRYIEFHPFWNIPRSIAVRETLPRLRRDPGYFDRAGMEFVMGDGRVVRSLSDSAMHAVANGGARLRQRPGPQNAMGDIKFILPNNSSIYLHHTPSVGLFERSRRDFSHGCIRVETPVPLAEFVLANPVSWSPAQISSAIHAGRNRTVELQTPVQVMVVYSTVAVNDGVVHFLPDVYGHDTARPAPEGKSRSASNASSQVRQPSLVDHNIDVPSGWQQRGPDPAPHQELPQ